MDWTSGLGLGGLDCGGLDGWIGLIGIIYSVMHLCIP